MVTQRKHWVCLGWGGRHQGQQPCCGANAGPAEALRGRRPTGLQQLPDMLTHTSCWHFTALTLGLLSSFAPLSQATCCRGRRAAR